MSAGAPSRPPAGPAGGHARSEASPRGTSCPLWDAREGPDRHGPMDVLARGHPPCGVVSPASPPGPCPDALFPPLPATPGRFGCPAWRERGDAVAALEGTASAHHPTRGWPRGNGTTARGWPRGNVTAADGLARSSLAALTCCGTVGDSLVPRAPASAARSPRYPRERQPGGAVRLARRPWGSPLAD